MHMLNAWFKRAAGFSGCVVATAALAQTYPTRPIELIVHTSPGSGGDIVSRAVSEIMRKEKLLPQPLLVVNRSGGSGVVGFSFFKTKRGDPYYLASVTGTIIILALRPEVNISLDNYTPLALFAIDPQTVMVRADSPYKTVRDLLEAGRKNPDTLVATTTAVVGTGRMMIKNLERQAPGARFKIVNFKGGGEAVISVAGGHTTFTVENLSEAQSFIEAKQMRVLALASNQRMPQAPDVPTLQELGIPITAGTLRGFAFTAGVPREAAVTMEAALAKAYQSQAWKDLAHRNVYENIYMGSAEFKAFLLKRYDEYKMFAEDMGLGKQ